MTIRYGLYTGSDRWCPQASDGAGCHLVLMDTAFGGMLDVAWIPRLLPRASVVSRSNSRDIQACLCVLGAGLAVLPRPLGDATAALTLVDLGEEPPSRDTWLGFHRDLRRLPRLHALTDLIIE